VRAYRSAVKLITRSVYDYRADDDSEGVPSEAPPDTTSRIIAAY